MNTAVVTEKQPAIYTLYAWHRLENCLLELKTHLVAAHSSDLAERFIREHQPSLVEDAECFISTDYVLDHLHSFGACRWNSNSITKGEPITEYEFKRWVNSLTAAQDDDGEVHSATIRAIQ